MVERAAAKVYRPSPPLNPASMDFAIAEITARQSELDQPAPRPMPPRSAPPMAPAMPAGPDFSSLERHLFKITSQIEALQRPDGIEQSISAFRSELAEIRSAITEAMPRRAIKSIENEIRSLSRRIDENKQSGSDGQVLANIERALGEIYDALRSLTPAEQLTGYDEAIRNLGGKLDLILRASDDPSTVRQLEGAIAALREIVSNVASNDALARLSDDVHTLSSKVDQLGRSEGHGDSFSVLEQRIAALTSTLESRERPVAGASTEHLEDALRSLSDQLDRMPVASASTGHIEDALRSLADRLDRMPVGNDSASAFAHLEQRVSYLLERLESSTDHRGGNANLGRVEDALTDILRHLESQHVNFAAVAENSRIALAESSRYAAQPQDSGLVDLVKRELTGIRFSQSETDRQTQESLEAVHNTLGHVVDRLAMIEGDLRNVRAQPVAPMPPPPNLLRRRPQHRAWRCRRNRSRNCPIPLPHRNISPQLRANSTPREPALPPVAAMAPRSISEILVPHTAPAHAAIEPDLPPDHPLEPGTRPSARVASPSERIAASESAISEIPGAPREPVSSSSFIAAARRAAQAAAAAPANDKAARGGPKPAAGDKAKNANKEPSTITSKIRSLLVGASVVVIVLGTFKMAMTLLDSGSVPPMPAMEEFEPAAAVAASARR